MDLNDGAFASHKHYKRLVGHVKGERRRGDAGKGKFFVPKMAQINSFLNSILFCTTKCGFAGGYPPMVVSRSNTPLRGTEGCRISPTPNGKGPAQSESASHL